MQLVIDKSRTLLLIMLLGANAKDGDLRLASTSQSKGIVQVFFNGTWGTYCRSTQYFTTFRKMCQRLGFRSYTSTQAIATNFFGYGPTIVNNIICKGNERTISECNSPGWYNVPQNCKDHSQDLFLQCYSKFDYLPS